MILYHYRPIESALKEIGDCTLHFATCAELNDPLEGYVRVFWQGDNAAWEGLLRNYICSLDQAIEVCVLQGNNDMLQHKTLVIDLHQFDNVPLGVIWKNLGERFLADEDVQRIAAFYGTHKLKVFEEELCWLLRLVHNKALVLCIQKNKEIGTMPESVADSLLKTLSPFENNSVVSELMNAKQTNLDHRTTILKFAEDTIEDMLDLYYVCDRGMQRNWMDAVVDFPRIYMNQLKEMIYPESYIVCFSSKNNDSAMWGNYADHHKGVCLIYETDSENCMTVEGKYTFTREVKPVNYGGEVIERNFYETFGRLNRRQIETWLTGSSGLSNSYQAFSNESEWRQRYWSAYNAKTYRKLKAWEHECEYRLAIDNSFYNLNDLKNRNLKFNPRNLKGLIFGIKTSEYDKQQIMKQLLKHADEYDDFTFCQAKYDGKGQTITIRKKNFWQLK